MDPQDSPRSTRTRSSSNGRPRAISLPEPSNAILRRSEEHTSELQSPDHLVCRPTYSAPFPYTTLFRSHALKATLANIVARPEHQRLPDFRLGQQLIRGNGPARLSQVNQNQIFIKRPAAGDQPAGAIKRDTA